MARKKAAKKARKKRTPKPPPHDHAFQPGNTVGKDNWFKPGNSGGPGRPPDIASPRAQIRQRAGEVVPGDKKQRTYAQKLAEAYFTKALKGNVRCMEGIIKNVDGKLDERIIIDWPEEIAKRAEEFTSRIVRLAQRKRNTQSSRRSAGRGPGTQTP